MNQAVTDIAHDIYARGCETIILLSPYASGNSAHLFNISPEFTASFGQYGEFLTQGKFRGDFELAYRICHDLGTEYHIAAITREHLDGASGAAMLQLGVLQPHYRMLPVYHAEGPTQYLFEFGKKMRDVLEQATSKIALISLGDMARTSKRNREEGRQLDQDILKNLTEQDTQHLLGRRPNEINKFALACVRPLAVLLGVLEGQSYQSEVLNYEQKYGVGMLAARFV
ncbi:hypothetical protein BK004_03410 [bacterium CG10_46_32]|nr:MAG: hypothetical protein BK004_03410 [bacterium CG10_46_32]